MNGVFGMTNLLLETELTEEQEDFVKMAHTACEDLMTVVNDILDFSKIESGRLKLRSVDFSLREAVNKAVRAVSGKAEEKQLTITSHVASSIPAQLSGDPSRFGQILNNLLSNAVKFTSSGGVTVDCASAELSGSYLVRVEVTDTGIGIAEDAIDHLFQPFWQFDDSWTRQYGGTGMGLAVCKQLACLMGGDLGLGSEPGKGSCFWFTVLMKAPASQRPVTASENTDPQAEEQGEATTQTA